MMHALLQTTETSKTPQPAVKVTAGDRSAEGAVADTPASAQEPNIEGETGAETFGSVFDAMETARVAVDVGKPGATTVEVDGETKTNVASAPSSDRGSDDVTAEDDQPRDMRRNDTRGQGPQVDSERAEPPVFSSSKTSAVGETADAPIENPGRDRAPQMAAASSDMDQSSGSGQSNAGNDVGKGTTDKPAVVSRHAVENILTQQAVVEVAKQSAPTSEKVDTRALVKVSGSDPQIEKPTEGPADKSPIPETSAQSVQRGSGLTHEDPAFAARVQPESETRVQRKGEELVKPQKTGVTSVPLQQQSAPTTVTTSEALSENVIANERSPRIMQSETEVRRGLENANTSTAVFSVLQAKTGQTQQAALNQTIYLKSLSSQSKLATSQADLSEVVQWDLRASQTTSSAQLSATTPQPLRMDIPPNVASQIAAAMHRAPDKPIEIALNPPELGRVRMMLSASESGIVVQVLTDRSETLDLMRRNADDLGRSLNDLGYEDISFEFGYNEGAESEQRETSEADAVVLELDTNPAPHNRQPSGVLAPLSVVSDGVDIRI